MWIAGNRYQETSELAFNLAGQPDHAELVRELTAQSRRGWQDALPDE